jgi:hypothetical protein
VQIKPQKGGIVLGKSSDFRNRTTANHVFLGTGLYEAQHILGKVLVNTCVFRDRVVQGSAVGGTGPRKFRWFRRQVNEHCDFFGFASFVGCANPQRAATFLQGDKSCANLVTMSAFSFFREIEIITSFCGDFRLLSTTGFPFFLFDNIYTDFLCIYD